jgi:transcriptional regulator of met regulon
MARPKKEETLTKLTIRVPNKTIKVLQSESKKSGTTLSDTIRKKLG